MARKNNLLGKTIKSLPFVGTPAPRVNVIELKGAIGVAGIGQRSLSLSSVQETIEKAFAPSKLTAVALSINSPGGSPVQSNLIMSAIRREAKKAEVPVLAFIEDVGASGGYMLALAGDEIYADPSSIVGSIGVISSGFGFTSAIDRLGVERRVYTAGTNKSQLDPFRPEDPKDVERLKGILTEMHETFKALVRDRRGIVLKEDDETFSGAFWTADQAKSRGLIDGIAHLTDFLQARYGEDVKVETVGQKRSPLAKIFGARRPAGRVGQRDAQLDLALNAQLVDLAALAGVLEEKALWARFGR